MTETAQDATAAGLGPEGEPENEGGAAADREGAGPVPDTFDREYVAGLRSEAASWRTKARDAEARLAEIEDAQKSEAQKALDRAERAESELAGYRAAELRREAAGKAGLPLEFADRVKGESSEAMEADAKELAKHLKAASNPPPGSYDNGAAGQGSGRGTNMDALIRASAR